MLENVELSKANPQRSTSIIKVEKHFSKSGLSKIVNQGFIKLKDKNGINNNWILLSVDFHPLAELQ